MTNKPINIEGSDGGPIPSGETFSPTNGLRFVVRVEGPTIKRILQQMWQGSHGSQRWEDVPSIHANQIE